MTEHWLKFSAILLLALLGGGILVFLVYAVSQDGKASMADGGFLAAAFMSLREVFGKIETIIAGVRRVPDAAQEAA